MSHLNQADGELQEWEPGTYTLFQRVQMESWGLDPISDDVGNYESFYYACPPVYAEQGFTFCCYYCTKPLLFAWDNG